MLPLVDIYKCIDAKSFSLPAGKKTKIIQPAGFSFFLNHEWHISLDTDTGDLKVSPECFFDESKSIALNYIDLFEANRAENDQFGYILETCYSYKLKYNTAHSFINHFSIDTKQAKPNEEDIEKVFDATFTSRAKNADRKVTSLVKKFSQNNQNIYSLLCVSEKDTSAHIRKMYLRIAMILHPDKSANLKANGVKGESREDKLINEYISKYKINNMTEEQKNELFLTVQDAYAILSDDAMRFEYECMMPFDDSIPTPTQIANANEDYYTFMSKYFELNAKWSKTTPVPKFGDENTSDSDVDIFYSFWRNFDSKRVFCAHFPHLIDEAENREERRWMERENAKVQKKMLKSDILRIQKLVDIAQATDPRIKRRQMQKRILKQQRKEEQIQRLKEERERIVMEEQMKLEKVQRESQELKVKRQLAKKWKYHLKLILNATEALNAEEISHLANIDYSGLYNLMLKFLTIIQMNQVVMIYRGNDVLEYTSAVKLFESSFPNLIIDSETKIKIAEEWRGIQLNGTVPLSHNDNPASKPANSTSNHNADTQTVNDGADCPNDKNSTNRPNNGYNYWTIHELSLLAKAIQLYPVGTADRWKFIANCVPSRTTSEVIKKANEVASGVTVSKVSATTDTCTSVTNGVATGNAKSGEWTVEHQRAFEKALEANPPSSAPDPKTRWINIAKSVPGKTPKECLDRFKQIREAILAKSKIKK